VSKEQISENQTADSGEQSHRAEGREQKLKRAFGERDSEKEVESKMKETERIKQGVKTRAHTSYSRGHAEVAGHPNIRYNIYSTLHNIDVQNANKIVEGRQWHEVSVGCCSDAGKHVVNQLPAAVCHVYSILSTII
jgi:hypothetical protein